MQPFWWRTSMRRTLRPMVLLSRKQQASPTPCRARDHIKTAGSPPVCRRFVRQHRGVQVSVPMAGDSANGIVVCVLSCCRRRDVDTQ